MALDNFEEYSTEYNEISSSCGPTNSIDIAYTETNND